MYMFNHILKVTDKLLLLHAVEIIVVLQDTISLQLFFFFFLAFSEFHSMFIKESVGIHFLIIIIMIIIIMMMMMIIIVMMMIIIIIITLLSLLFFNQI